jgi:hypothetical protein
LQFYFSAVAPVGRRVRLCARWSNKNFAVNLLPCRGKRYQGLRSQVLPAENPRNQVWNGGCPSTSLSPIAPSLSLKL